MVASGCRGRCGLRTRRARPGTAWRGRARRRGSRARLRRRRRSARAAGDRVKTDRRDAERLARLLRMGELVAVRVPEPHEEAARDLVRAREDVRGDLMRARHRLSKLLFRHGLVYDGSAWTLAYDAWLRRQRFDESAARACVRRVLRRDVADKGAAGCARRTRSWSSPRAAVCCDRGAACCLRGVSTLTALGAEGRGRRLEEVPAAVARPFLGLTPSEDSTGERRRQGAITKTGNTHARRLLVEAAWHQRRPLRSSRRSSGADRASLPRSTPGPTGAPAGCTPAGSARRGAASDERSSRSPSRASSLATAGRSP